MSYADRLFVENCARILEDGISDEGTNVRPKWEDGTPAYTKKILYVQDEYQLAKDSIPVMTLRKQFIKSATDEILWIYQKKTPKISELNSKVWDSWDVGDGTIGKGYGYQIAQKAKHHKLATDDSTRAFLEARCVNYYGKGREFLMLANKDKYEEFPSAELRRDERGVYWVWLDQMDAVLYDLKYNWASRSIMTNTYNHQDLADMGLRPCAYSMQYNVTVENGEKVLNGCLFQRSQDTLTANGWNVIQYSVLLQMVAQAVDMKPGKFVHCIADMHIYDRHIPIVQEMIDKYDEALAEAARKNVTMSENDVEEFGNVPHPNPKFWINPEITNFYDFTPSDVKLLDYEYEEFDHKIEVAI